MESEPLTTFETIALSFVFLSVMFLPGIIAYRINHRRKLLIAITSVLLGWTVIIGMAMLIYVITQSSKFKKAKYSKSGQSIENFYYKHKIIIISVITIFVISVFLYEQIFIR
tara:strand:- start:274 stop:609 length:336 start_codon:yes stop_codon:yes gene_type:complete